jgi:hypothetical protein
MESPKIIPIIYRDIVLIANGEASLMMLGLQEKSGRKNVLFVLGVGVSF